jgi:hypothetical protein
MSRAPTPPPPDPSRAVKPTAGLSMLLLLAASLSGLFAGGSETGALLHAIAVTVALPVSFVAHLVAVVALSERASRAEAPAGGRDASDVKTVG